MWSILIALIHPALAQQESCDGVLPLESLRLAMDAVDEALIELDGARSDRILDDIVYEMRCVDAPVDPTDLGRLARQVSLVAFFAQEHDEVEYWLGLAHQTLGGAPWPPELPVPDRLLELEGELPELGEGGPGGGFSLERGGWALLDGRFRGEATALLGAQHLVQLVDKKGQVLHTSWFDGGRFPDEVLGAVSLSEAPKGYVAPADPAPWPEAEPPSPEEVPAPEERTLSFKETPCPWGKPRKASATHKEVRVNRRTFPVRTSADQDTFRRVLRTCGEYRAARRFTRWIEARRGLGFGAKALRESMVEAILSDEPRRRRRGRSGRTPSREARGHSSPGSDRDHT